MIFKGLFEMVKVYCELKGIIMDWFGGNVDLSVSKDLREAVEMFLAEAKELGNEIEFSAEEIIELVLDDEIGEQH
jgi:hypothetical protein